ncbi:hypothetical protein LEM8419_03394 [Neolewinella maritima]|uniref:Uncharacterized protein n=1 Tax=Neolewinella maritima TaxID=1383882 RepID=A0ABM9B558_9BACT|nr:hypothetical protein [Neolewinella maritima]CAH1002515.1 hypothetical protein LEM8419_03394 [Neolewinella maritima]
MATNNNTELDTTIAALDQGLNEAKTDASATIHNWIGTLNGSNDQAQKKIAGDLQLLESALGADTVNTNEVKQLLASLGQQTTAAAGRAEGLTSNKLAQLGRKLTDAAASMDVQ